MDMGTPIRTDRLLQEIVEWIKKAENQGIPEPNAMCLSTVNSVPSTKPHPSSRMVLLKGIEMEGLAFYTNFNSHKAQEINVNPFVALNFFWAPLSKQIRVLGSIKKINHDSAVSYFKTRARESQVGAWASDQSHKIPNREYLISKVAEYEKKFEGMEVPCPPHWGGFTVLPTQIEFWTGMVGRLHERWVFERSSTQSSDWDRFLLSP